jgi:hypothetical protein
MRIETLDTTLTGTNATLSYAFNGSVPNHDYLIGLSVRAKRVHVATSTLSVDVEAMVRAYLCDKAVVNPDSGFNFLNKYLVRGTCCWEGRIPAVYPFSVKIFLSKGIATDYFVATLLFASRGELGG